MPNSYQPIIYRTRFGREIVAEVALPERQTGRVIVLAQGFPSSPSKRAVLDFLTGEGYVVVFPRYRGTWESDGYFLDRSPTEDIREVIETLEREKKILVQLFSSVDSPTSKIFLYYWKLFWWSGSSLDEYVATSEKSSLAVTGHRLVCRGRGRILC